jgi:alpha/beta superfamily hydrolase
MKMFSARMGVGFCIAGLGWLVAAVVAAQTAVAWDNLTEQKLSVPLSLGAEQVGVLSLRRDSPNPDILAVLLIGHPSVLRPVVSEQRMLASQMDGNFLVRARRHLADERIALLLVDCRSDSGAECTAAYQASVQRQTDVAALVQAARQVLPSIQSVWLVSTSMGSISSAFMAMHGQGLYAGAIHTASITEPDAVGAYPQLSGFDYGQIQGVQAFVHHQNDPCPLTTYAGAVRLAQKFSIPLVTVRGGSGFQGRPCQAFSEHGFRGKEREVMQHIAQILKSGQARNAEVR